MVCDSAPVVFTVGHSTRTLEEFVALLRAHGVRRLVDVRTIPRSRHNPHFSADVLGPSLRNRGIGYRQARALGGLRHARADSPNTGWHNASFRGYADYMQTPAFAEALDKLMAWCRERPTAIMCAEAVPWRCHRQLIADALVIHGFEVRDVISPHQAKCHRLSSMARRQGTHLVYPPSS